MTKSFEDASRREDGNRYGPFRSIAGRAVPRPGSDSDWFITWASYVTVLHLLYLAWREASGEGSADERP